MHTSDSGGGKSAQGSDLGIEMNKCIGPGKGRSKKEVMETKNLKVMVPKKPKDGNKFIPKVRVMNASYADSLKRL